MKLYRQGQFQGLIPSRSTFYNRFSTASSNKCDCKDILGEDWETRISNNVGSDQGLAGMKSMFPKAYCCACKMNKDNPSNDDWCHFLYYWIGDIVSEDSDISKWTKTLEDIYNAFTDISIQNKCNIVYKNKVPWDIFYNRRTVFDYWKDSDAIKAILEGSGPNCSEQYGYYLDTMLSSYFAVSAHCTKNKGDDYCKSFWVQNKDDILMKLLKLQCESDNKLQTVKEASTASSQLQEKLQQEQAKASKAKDEAVRNAKTTSSITSIFGTLAATAFPFFLYKYKPWSSWFGNHTFGNGGGRRSTRRKRSTTRNLDTFTENSSTYDSTTESTIADSTAEDSTTLRSAAYSAQPRGRTNNAGGRGMVGYQNM
ncbi:KIR protein [Plasmodium coatneyi]|uniref:KIR protein n=1 Tax=Plasmodium coatneyi TaxID=208452 RepID=A0A1B1E3S6_9APIC|nr:KIR protein [Plasmodium coatneyi]ANQ09656.1 KIR protein [Plasmodium coatneyi]